MLVIEHNHDVIKTADYLIDMGPEGGNGGGEVVGVGTPEELANNPRSHTGRYLAEMFDAKKGTCFGLSLPFPLALKVCGRSGGSTRVKPVKE